MQQGAPCPRLLQPPQLLLTPSPSQEYSQSLRARMGNTVATDDEINFFVRMQGQRLAAQQLYGPPPQWLPQVRDAATPVPVKGTLVVVPQVLVGRRHSCVRACVRG